MPKFAVKRRRLQVVGLAWLLIAASAHSQGSASVIEGVWSSTLTTPENPGWRIEDHLCGSCTPSEYRHLERLLADPANDRRSLRELQREARDASQREIDELVIPAARERLSSIEQSTDPSAACDPPSLLAVANNPLPVAIELRDDQVILRSQHWNVVRAVRLSEQSPTAVGEPTLYGNATARIEGAALIVESVNLLPMATAEGVTTTQARIVERYTASADGARLYLELAIHDPGTYREPRVLYRPRIRTPNVQLVEDEPCANLDDDGEGQ